MVTQNCRFSSSKKNISNTPKTKLKTTVVDGDLLDQKTDVIAHQVNCLGVMGAGVALQIKNKWPEVYEGYKNFCHDELNRLGAMQT
jgi:O-acetyl-ADP-ribose deacetylase (regulator of RNase III)